MCQKFNKKYKVARQSLAEGSHNHDKQDLVRPKACQKFSSRDKNVNPCMFIVAACKPKS